jgi:hypothetical protein
MLVPGMVVACELEAIAHGYAARAVHALAVGEAGPVLPELYGIVGSLWERAYTELRPGISIGAIEGELRAQVRQLVKPRGPLRNASAQLTLSGAGLGADLPRYAGTEGRTSPSPTVTSPAVDEGWICSLGITLRADVEGRQYLASRSDPVAVTSAGCVRLGGRPPGWFPTG